MRQITLDTETTGLDVSNGHRVIEIGCTEIIDRKFTGNELHFYLNPERDIDPGAVAVHGLSKEFLSDKPFFSDIAEDLLTFLMIFPRFWKQKRVQKPYKKTQKSKKSM